MCFPGTTITSKTLHITIAEGNVADIDPDTTPTIVAESVSNADTGSVMRVNGSGYIYNFSTKQLKQGQDYTIRIRDGVQRSDHPQGPVPAQEVAARAVADLARGVREPRRKRRPRLHGNEEPGPQAVRALCHRARGVVLWAPGGPIGLGSLAISLRGLAGVLPISLGGFASGRVLLLAGVIRNEDGTARLGSRPSRQSAPRARRTPSMFRVRPR